MFYIRGQQKNDTCINHYLIRVYFTLLTELDFKDRMVPCFQDRRNSNHQHKSPVLLQRKCWR